MFPQNEHNSTLTMLVCYTFNIAVEQYYNSTGCVDLLQFIGTEWLQKSDIQKYNLLNTKLTFDAVWVKSFYTSRNYGGIGNSIYEIFDYFKKYNKSPPLYPNNKHIL